MSKTGGSGIARQSIINNDNAFFNPSFDWRVILPLVSIGLVLAAHLILPAHESYRLKLLSYFSDFLKILLLIYGAAAVVSVFCRRIRDVLSFKAAFHASGFLSLGVYDLATLKFQLIPVIYFPAPERILGVFVEDGFFLLRCLVYSLRLLLSGFVLWALAGVFTGRVIGWSRRFNYWIMPFIRMVGPIPSTAWIPVALVIFFKPASASVFLIALGVWFPTTVLTNSGIMNVRKNFFEVSAIWQKQKMTTVMVTHDVDEAIYMATRVIVMSARPAKIERVIKVEKAYPHQRDDYDFLELRAEILRILHFAGKR